MAEITIKDVTTGAVNGSGAFDKLMASAQVRLDQEWHKNRIRGPDYTKVYLGQLEAVLQNSIMFVLGQQEADAAAELTKEKTLTEAKNRELVIAQIGKMKKEEALIDQQILKMIQEVLVMEGEVRMVDDKIALLKAQVVKMQKEGELIDGQIRKMSQEILLMEGQVLKMEQEIEVMKGEVSMIPGKLKLINAQADKAIEEVFLIKGQVEKMQSEILVMEQQVLESEQKVLSMKAAVWAERAKTESTCKIFAADYAPVCTNPDDKVTGLVGMQITKSEHEGDLLQQKTLTEEAQTKNRIGEGTDAYDVSGVIGKQKSLYQKQTDGFDRDAEQKLSKILVDTWNVRRTNDDQLPTGGTGLEDDQINNVLDIAKVGIGAEINNPSYGIKFAINADKVVYEDCPLTFSSGINLPADWPKKTATVKGIAIKTWNWYVVGGGAVPSGKIADHGDMDGLLHWYQFRTKLEEPGANVIGLTITLEDNRDDPKMDGVTVDYKQTFNAIETDTIGGVTPCPNSAGYVMTAKEKAVHDRYRTQHADLLLTTKQKAAQAAAGYTGWDNEAENHAQHK